MLAFVALPKTEDFYLAHYDLENDPGRTEALGVGPTGLSAWIDVITRPPGHEPDGQGRSSALRLTRSR
jgi:hypothetical protein